MSLPVDEPVDEEVDKEDDSSMEDFLIVVFFAVICTQTRNR